MSFGLGDIKIVIEFFNYIKKKYFSGPNWENESLQQDIARYFKEFYTELKSVNREAKINDKEGDEILGPAYEELKRLDSLDKDDMNPEEFDNTYLEKCFDDYMECGDYKKILQDFRIKMNSYGSAVRECIENYGNNDGKKLKKERKLFDDFLSENLQKIKECYIDFILVCLFPKRLDSNSRKYIIYESVERLDFEKYMPAIHKFLDKIDNRVLVK